jgi:hypothetical protein
MTEMMKELYLFLVVAIAIVHAQSINCTPGETVVNGFIKSECYTSTTAYRGWRPIGISFVELLYQITVLFAQAACRRRRPR